MLVKVFDYLYSCGVEVYFIGQKKGDCLSNYVVIKDNGTIPTIGNKLGTQIIDICCYVPINQFTETEKYKTKIKELLKSFKSLRSTGIETPAIADDEFKAYSSSIEYITQKTL